MYYLSPIGYSSVSFFFTLEFKLLLFLCEYAFVCSGADLSQVLKEAGKIAMREMMDELQQSNPDALKSEEQLPDVIVSQHHLLGALARVTPSVSVRHFVVRVNALCEAVDVIKNRLSCTLYLPEIVAR
jgi:SpoVK/Ycf46/Vps4 family AAA+-type ATPase